MNHQEVRELDKSLVTSTAVRATLTVREAERGFTVATKSATVE